MNRFPELVWKKKAFHQIRHWELELLATNSQDLSGCQDCSAVCQVITTGKDGPRKKHDKTESSNNWRGYSPPIPEKKKLRQKRKLIRRPAALTLQFCRKWRTTLCLVSFIIFAENRSRNSTKHRARYFFFCFEINNLRTFSKRRGLSLEKLYNLFENESRYIFVHTLTPGITASSSTKLELNWI